MDVRSGARIIAIVGPESTGKTTLAKQLAAHFKGALVEEYARGFLNTLPRPYVQSDLLAIAQGQFRSEQEALAGGNPTVVCDTDLSVIQVWSEVRYDSTDPAILTLLNQQPDRLHLLTRPDLPWESDHQREHPDDRDMLFARYVALLEARGANYVIIEGIGDVRLKNALAAVEGASIRK